MPPQRCPRRARCHRRLPPTRRRRRPCSDVAARHARHADERARCRRAAPDADGRAHADGRDRDDAIADAAAELRDGAAAAAAARGRAGRCAERRRARERTPTCVAALQQVLMATASDLHVTVNAPPMIRVDGALRPISGTAVGAAQGHERPLQHHERVPAGGVRARPRARLRVHRSPRTRASASTSTSSATRSAAAFRLIPTEIKPLEALGVPESVGRFADAAPRARARDRADRLGQVDDPRGAHRPRQPHARRPHRDGRGPDRVPAHATSSSLINQREVGHDTHSFADGAQARAAPGPGRHPRRRAARPRDHLGRAHRRRDRSPRLRDAAHAGRRRRPSTASSTCSRRTSRGRCAAQLAATLQGVVCQTLVKHASGTGRVVATEVMVTTPAIANLIREGKTYQISSAMQAGRELGMHTMDQHLADLVNAGQITYQAARREGARPRGLQAPRAPRRDAASTRAARERRLRRPLLEGAA